MNEQNLHSYKPGQCGNPKGRPKKSVLVKKRWAKLLGIDPKHLEGMNVEEMPEALTYALKLSVSEAKALRQNAEVTMGELAALSMANKLVKTGDVKCWAEIYELITGEKLMDTKQEVELSTAEGSCINIVLKDPKDKELFENDEDF